MKLIRALSMRLRPDPVFPEEAESQSGGGDFPENNEMKFRIMSNFNVKIDS